MKETEGRPVRVNPLQFRWEVRFGFYGAVFATPLVTQC